MEEQQVDRVLVYLFGFRSDPPPGAAEQATASLVTRFLSGDPVDFTPDLAAGMLREFAAQERYRQKLVSALQALASDLTVRASRHLSGLETPPCSVQDAVLQGTHIGAYDALGAAAAAVQDALEAAMAEAGG